MERVGRIALKTVLWIVAFVIFLIVLVFFLIQVPSVQNFAKNKVVSFLQDKIKTKVKIDRLSIEFPKMIVLEGVYFADQKGDTLLAGDKLKINITMLQLLHKKVEINEINLQGITSNVIRTPDSNFNYTYIMKAFMSQQKQQPKPDDTTSTLKFALDKINLDRINIKYQDAISGGNVKFILNHFDTRVKDFDLDKMKFTIPKITLSGFDAKIIQTPTGPAPATATAPDTAAKPMNISLNLGVIDLSKINVDYQSSEMKTNVNMGKLLVDMDKIDLKNQVVNIKSIQLADTKALLALAKAQTVQKKVVKAIKKADTVLASPQSGKGWSLNLGKVQFANDNVKFDNDGQKPVAKGIDYMHMNIRGLNAEAENIAYSSTTISGKINTFTFTEKSGLDIKNFHTTFLYGEKQSYLNDLYLETPQTVIRDHIQVGYQSMATISDHLGDLRINANLKDSKLGLKDVLILMPSMASMEPFKHSPNAVFHVNARVEGQVNNLSIPNFEVTGLSSTRVKVSGTIKGLPSVDKSVYDLRIENFNTTSADINKLVSPGMIPASVSIPAQMNARGTFKGGIKNFVTNLNLQSSDGNVVAIASLKMGSKGSIAYTANVNASNLNVGKLTRQEKTVGKMTLTAKVNGSGTDVKTANATFSGNIARAAVQGYTYHNLVFNGSIKSGNIAAIARMKDPNLAFAMDVKANMSKKYPSVLGTITVDSANLMKLGFSKDTLLFHGKVVANVPTADPDYLNGNIQLTDLLIVNKGQRIKLDSISLVSTARADSSTLRLKSQIMSAHLSGKYKLTEISTAMQDAISKYFNSTPTAAKAKYSPEQFTFDAIIVKTPLFKQFVPDLKQLDPVKLTGSFDSQTGKLVVNGAAPKIIYATNVVNNLKLNINTSDALIYSVTADEIKASQADLLFTSISGNAQNNKLNISLQVRDSKKKERYRIAGVLSALTNEYQFSFLPDGLLLDYTPWTVNADNALQFGSLGILAKDFAITNANQVLSINSMPQQMNGPLNINFESFKIETLTKLANQGSLLVGGVINGSATVKNLDKTAQYTSDLNISNFNFKGDTVGDIAIKVNNQTANAIAANVGITGKGNQVNLDGLYYTDNSSFDMNLNIVNLNLKSIEGFSFGNLKQASGSINSQLKITGTTSAPSIRGDINFNKAAFNISMLNSYFRMPDEKITFNNDGILFHDFTLIDSAGSKAIVTGTIYTKTYTDYSFGVDIHTDNFRVFNATENDNKLYYGQLYLDSQIKIRGNLDKPVVDATIKVNEKTRLTIVLPQDDPGIEDRKGVVEFVDKKHPKLDSLLKGQLDSLKKSNLTGMDISANISTDKNAEFIIVVDERNGDIVHIKGESQLNGGIDLSGKTNLTGTFTVNQGSYDLAYTGFSRKFLFKQGSTITWQGDPTSATLNLTAIYVAKIPPIDLVESQLTNETEKTMYKTKLPFNVDLILTNQLMKPDIAFNIVLPDSTYNVSTDVVTTVNTKLDQIRQDPNELNKQVFAVLLLNHFIDQNPFQSNGGSSGIEGSIRNSVSSLLSSQLNSLAGNLIKGVDVNFALQSGEDYSSGTATNRTDLNVGLSKRFLNDRLTVSVGNNFNLEGQQSNEKATNIAGDISVGYKLTKDGRYLLRAYRRDQFIVIEGQVIETGVGFSLTVDYNRFSQIFKGKSPQAKEMAKKQKEEDKAKKQQDKDQPQKPTTSSSN